MATPTLAPRQTFSPVPTGTSGNDGGSSEFLRLISNPFTSELNQTSFEASLIWTLVGSATLALLFCFLRPRTNAVYAPRAKHADEKHQPPKLNKGLFSWVRPILTINETELIEKCGLDAAVFLRFLRMCRNIFIVMTVIGVAIIIPVNLTGTHATPEYGKTSWFMKFTPQFNSGSKFWAFTVTAYVFNIVACGFLWWNYKAVFRLRRQYFQSREYSSSLHARTLLLTHIPTSFRTDEGVTRLAAEAKPTRDFVVGAIGRNVRDLPDLIEEHEDSVERLEKILAKYLRDPNRLPATRPKCKPAKKDKARDHSVEVDAIDYYSERIRELEREIYQVRETVDRRNPMPFGFASYAYVEDAHGVAHAARKKSPQGTTVELAPQSHDIIWKNLPMTRKVRRTKAYWNGFWMTVLTVLYIVPNTLTAVFLSDLANLGLVWPSFQRSLEAHRTLWGIIQGIVAPAVQTAVYLVLPIIFRRMFQHAGEPTKTSRERHVASRLYTFTVFNRLIVFSVFAAIWHFVAGLIGASNSIGGITWQTIKDQHIFRNIVLGLINASPFWITAQLQNNIGAAVDISQLLPLIWGSFMRRFSSPTPRETIKLSAPQPVEYASYYNTYLFAAAVGFSFATIQPLILPVTAFYFAVESWAKKYLLLYVLITKTESGGLFWRTLFNRFLVSILLGDLVIALVVGALGVTDQGLASATGAMLYALIPLPFLIIGFKIYCMRTFDDGINYFSTRTRSELDGAAVEASSNAKRHLDRVGVKYGNPALYKRLITPMVAAKSQHLLREIYHGRLQDQEIDALDDNTGSDVYMSRMAKGVPGKVAGRNGPNAPFEAVPESEMDFEYFKKRAEFREEFGGQGQLYGSSDSATNSRPGSRASMSTLGFMGKAGAYDAQGGPTSWHQYRRSDSPTNDSRASSRTRHELYGSQDVGTVYPRGYHQAETLRNSSPQGRGRQGSVDITTTGHPAFRDDSYGDGRGRLMQSAAEMGRRSGSGSPAPIYTPYSYHGRDGSGSQPGSPGMQRPGSANYRAAGYGYGGGFGDGTPDSDQEDGTSYDYFRRGRRG